MNKFLLLTKMYILDIPVPNKNYSSIFHINIIGYIIMITPWNLLSISLKIAFYLIETITKDTASQDVIEQAKREAKIAYLVLENAEREKDPTDGVKRAIAHLESAYSCYHYCLEKYQLKDKNKALVELWDINTNINSICLSLSILHHKIGNIKLAEFWLIEKLTDKGGIVFPEEILESLNIDSELYSKEFCQSSYDKIKDLKNKSDENWEYIVSVPSSEAPFFQSASHSGG